MSPLSGSLAQNKIVMHNFSGIYLKLNYRGPGPTISGHDEGVQNSEMVP
jgi:hypothetical protein